MVSQVLVASCALMLGCVPGTGATQRQLPLLNRLSEGGGRASVQEGPWAGKGTGQGKRDLFSVMPAFCRHFLPFRVLSSPPAIVELLHG